MCMLFCLFLDGFRKVVNITTGAIKSETEDVEFHHPYFQRGEEHLLENIKRKTQHVSCVQNLMKF